MLELEKAQKAAWRYYKNWQAERPLTRCAALKCEVSVTKRGWEHLVGSRRAVKRNPKDAIHRFHILPHARKVILGAKDAKQRIQNSQLFYYLDLKITGRVIRVVLEEDERGNKVFLSVIDKT